MGTAGTGISSLAFNSGPVAGSETLVKDDEGLGAFREVDTAALVVVMFLYMRLGTGVDSDLARCTTILSDDGMMTVAAAGVTPWPDPSGEVLVGVDVVAVTLGADSMGGDGCCWAKGVVLGESVAR